MTNRGILKKYVEYLLLRLKKSPDRNDRDLFKYLEKCKSRDLKSSPSRILKDWGEMSDLNWRHNVSPLKLRVLIREANRNKHRPSYIRAAVLKHVRV